jgi:hypothetical protein
MPHNIVGGGRGNAELSHAGRDRRRNSPLLLRASLSSEQNLLPGAHHALCADPIGLLKVPWIGDRGNLFRNGKHNVEVLAIEKFGLTALDPLSASQRLTFRTVAISARPVANTLVAALIALFDLAPESRCAADLDRSHGAPLRCGH